MKLCQELSRALKCCSKHQLFTKALPIKARLKLSLSIKFNKRSIPSISRSFQKLAQKQFHSDVFSALTPHFSQNIHRTHVTSTRNIWNYANVQISRSTPYAAITLRWTRGWHENISRFKWIIEKLSFKCFNQKTSRRKIDLQVQVQLDLYWAMARKLKISI